MIQEGTMTSLPGDIIMRNYSQNHKGLLHLTAFVLMGMSGYLAQCKPIISFSLMIIIYLEISNLIKNKYTPYFLLLIIDTHS
jgi:hypothetical protein